MLRRLCKKSQQREQSKRQAEKNRMEAIALIAEALTELPAALKKVGKQPQTFKYKAVLGHRQYRGWIIAYHGRIFLSEDGKFYCQHTDKRTEYSRSKAAEAVLSRDLNGPGSDYSGPHSFEAAIGPARALYQAGEVEKAVKEYFRVVLTYSPDLSWM